MHRRIHEENNLILQKIRLRHMDLHYKSLNLLKFDNSSREKLKGQVALTDRSTQHMHMIREQVTEFNHNCKLVIFRP